MTSPAVLFAPLMLLFTPPLPTGGQDAHLLPRAEQRDAPGADRAAPGWLAIEAARSVPAQAQVRIEQRVIIRIGPRSDSGRQNMSSFVAPRAAPSRRVVEREAGECLPVAAIGAVQPSRDNRLMLYMRDRRVYAARLERSCFARDFYSGFYVERNSDGMLCVDRDKLQSRNGVKCEVQKLHRLVAERD
ncbi:hypothetical protein GRI72_06730 [Altererythrobacter marinus]|uniref:Uncharacterized protein n=1 Tax=Pelagerythrobacter marinus TaxID=538382 RepID=A0ABW9UX59_9SPHN|nr:hypothetical protein [Pelagerythrobacter marinus]MXO68519.1 hypothetical protein [Pelagerythrobacter marinus]